MLLSLFTSVHVAAWVMLALIVARAAGGSIERFVVPAATAADLGFVRIWCCGLLLVYILLVEDLPSIARYDSSWYSPPGYAGMLGEAFWRAWIDPLRLRLLEWTLVGTLGFAVCGLFTRVSLPCAAVLYWTAAAILRMSGKEFHTGYLTGYLILVLAFLPCGDGWSLDSIRRRRSRVAGANHRDEPASDALRYGWCLMACYAAVSVPYLQLGFSKLITGGSGWLNGKGLLFFILTDNLNISRFNIDLGMMVYHFPELLFSVSACVTVIAEISYAMVVFSPAARKVLPGVIGLLHLGIFLIQDVFFFDAILLPVIFWRAGSAFSARSRETRRETGTQTRAAARLTSIVLVAMIFTLNCGTYLNFLPGRWPLATWTMYEESGPDSSEIYYRRFLVRYRDGSTRESDLREASGLFLGEYRIDHLFRKDPVHFLSHTLQLLQDGPDSGRPVALSYERRMWDYRKMNYADHLEREPPVGSLTVLLGPPRSGEAASGKPFSAVGDDPPNLLKNSAFTRYHGDPPLLGTPVDWEGAGPDSAIAVEPGTGKRMLALRSISGAAETAVAQAVHLAVAATDRILEFEVRLHSRDGSAFIALDIERVARAGIRSVVSSEISSDWQTAKIACKISPGDARPVTARAVLGRRKGGETAIFDSAILRVLPRSEPLHGEQNADCGF